VGDFAQGEAYLERLLESVRLIPPAPHLFYGTAAVSIPMVARISGVADRSEIAERAAGAVLGSPYGNPYVAVWARVGLGLLAVQRGDGAAAGEQYIALGRARGTMLTPFNVAADRLLGLLAQTLGELDKAAEHFEDALTFCRKAGYRPELAWACCDYADLLLNPVGAVREPPLQPTHTTPADRKKAMALLEEALQISSELGMRPLMERVLSRRQILRA
jgi:tetratricopeptide (TPR) repeat protein